MFRRLQITLREFLIMYAKVKHFYQTFVNKYIVHPLDKYKKKSLITSFICRFYWPRGLRRRSAAARLLRSWVRIPQAGWMFVCCECCVLSGRGLCDKLITRPEEFYWLWCIVVCDLETSRMRRPWPALGRSATAKKKKKKVLSILSFTLYYVIVYWMLPVFWFNVIIVHDTWRQKKLWWGYLSSLTCMHIRPQKDFAVLFATA